MLTWTIDHYHKKDRRREVTIYLEGKLTSRDCAGIYKLCFDNHSHCDHLVLDLAQIEERDVSMSVLICCLRKTAGFAAGHISLRGIPNRPPEPTTNFLGISHEETCEFHNNCHSSVSRLSYGAPLVGKWPGVTQ
jgi:ABC-type transporter Mla MlaB component